jgi:CheY-like chemotaxis protein
MILSGIQWLKKLLKPKSLDSRFRGNDTKKCYDTVSKGRGVINETFSQLKLTSRKLVDFMKDILAVDDDPEVLKLIQLSLQAEGYHIRAVKSGFAALDEMRSQIPDLLLLDILMPGLNGYDVCTEVRSQPKYAGLKIVFLSALSNPGDTKRGLIAGANDYIIKPFDPDALLAKVKQMIGPGK